MATYSVVIKKRNTANNSWDSILPITTAKNVLINESGDTADTHFNDKANPHEVTKSQVGLGDVDNTSDLSKPISTAVQTALDGKVDDSRVLTDVPAGAKFTDTITTVNGKTGAIAKSDITALGVPAQDTVYSHPTSHPASMITGLPTKLSELQNDIGAGGSSGMYDAVRDATYEFKITDGQLYIEEVG